MHLLIGNFSAVRYYESMAVGALMESGGSPLAACLDALVGVGTYLLNAKYPFSHFRLW